MPTLELTIHTNPTTQCSVNQIPFNIGSDPDNDLVINDPSVDSFHARIIQQQDQYLLIDLGSSRGTRVGSIQVQPLKPQLLIPNNLVQVGAVIIEGKLKIEATQIPKTRTESSPHKVVPDGLKLDAIRLYKSTRFIFGTTLINDIHLSILPKEFVVIAGVSGGGKSTLMDALNGQRPVAGKVLINGVNLYRNFNAFKNTIGYVPQDDIVHPELTVKEALNYAAQLRMPFLSRSERQQRIQSVLEELELTPRGVIGAVKYGAPPVAAAIFGIIAATMALVCASSGLRALAGDEKQAFVRDTAIAIAAWRGTSYIGADLTDADFTGATLKNTDLRETILTRTCWFQVQNINCARKEETYLNNLQRQKLLTQGEGSNNNFDSGNFRFLNLDGANLKNASFIGADFYQASLQQTDLSKAILVRTQLEGANLTGACLTGACIEDWVVTRTTELKGVICKYIYIKFVDGEKQERIPPRGEFQDGEFIRFVKSILDTIELYHEPDFKPRAAISVLKSLSKDYNEVLQIVGIKKRGNGIILELKISEWTDKEQLKEKYYTRYSQTLALFLEDPDNKFLFKDEVLEEKLKPHPITNTYFYIEQFTIIPENTGIVQNINHSQVHGGIQTAQGANNQQIIDNLNIEQNHKDVE